MGKKSDEEEMTWLALAGALIGLLQEILKLINDIRKDKKEAKDELKKQRTEKIQSIARGIIDRDASRINGGFDELRKLRKR